MTEPYVRPDVRAFLDILNQTPIAELEKLGAVPARELFDQVRLSRPSPTHHLAIVRDLECEGRGWPIRLRFYDLQEARGPGPMIVYFHGGGFVLGDLESHHQICIDIAQAVDLPVVSVDYRLAPEHPFPAAPEDAETVMRWLDAEGAAALDRGITAFVLAGDSAGGNLAAVTAGSLARAPARVPVIAQFLLYPTTGGDRSTESKRLFARGYFLTKAGIDWFDSSYAAPDGDDRYDLYATDLSSMPPTIVVTAGLDPLRDEGRGYAAALITVGVPVIFQEARGNIHGFFGSTSAIPSSAGDVTRALDALRVIANPRASPSLM
jgi:acetyl esterase